MRKLALAAMISALAACSAPETFTDVAVGQDTVKVIKRVDGSYTALKLAWVNPPRTRLILVQAIEKISGCTVIPETIVGGAGGIDADVRC